MGNNRIEDIEYALTKRDSTWAADHLRKGRTVRTEHTVSAGIHQFWVLDSRGLLTFSYGTSDAEQGLKYCWQGASRDRELCLWVSNKRYEEFVLVDEQD